jgi:creatinine amidohydrolase
MYLADHAWPDLEAYFEAESLALVPVGSTEQHGPHLPESTDYVIAESLAREAADRAGYLCTPTIPVGVSPHHKQFPGTMWVDPPAFRDYVESVTRNLTYHGIDRVVYVNAHGGNVAHLREVGRRLRDDDAAYAIEWMWDESIPDLVSNLFEHNGPHAGPKETALMQYLTDLVHDDRLADAHDGGVESITTDLTRHCGARTFYDCVENSPNGAFGDQTDAAAEKGRRLFEAATDQLCDLCDWLADRDWAELAAPPRM